MPCYSDPEDYKNRETDVLNNLLHFIDEVSVRHIPVFSKTHPEFERFENDKVNAINEFTQRLCFILSKENPTKYTRELQDWWQKHQEWDKQRIDEQKESRNNSNTGDGTGVHNSL